MAGNLQMENRRRSWMYNVLVSPEMISIWVRLEGQVLIDTNIHEAKAFYPMLEYANTAFRIKQLIAFDM